MDDDGVFLGVWTNWSRGKVMGLTFTTTRQHGNLLVAFTGFLIPFVASRFWCIFCLVFHQYFSTAESRDAVHHQRQVILRNSSSPDSGLASLLRLLWAWRKSYLCGENHHPRLFPVIFFAICCISAFTVAGGFSSQISSAPGDQVLIQDSLCGIEYVADSSNFTADAKSMAMMSEKINDAANYAQQCYSSSSSGVLDCDKFVVKSLSTTTTKNDSSCPFQGNICRGNDTNLRLDTGYIDSNDGLGLNAPGNQRFAWRYVLQCAPLITQGYTTQVTINNRSVVRYNYGAIDTVSNSTAKNFTYEIEDLDSQYFGLRGLYGTLAGFNFKLRRVY
jgi:hypothetical protein